jgi:NAD(P)-dependent dehydrogenase (short-subunit alcohol dehydrogenase family)
MDVAGKVMIVTGASSGIGAATARAASRAGARLVLAARDRTRLEAVAAGMANAVVVPTDMRNPDEIRHLVEIAVERCGRVDILVNNAGQGLHVPVEDIMLDDLVAVMELNVYGTLLAMQAVIPVMRSAGGGCIINVSSGTTRLGAPVGAGGYSATKAALNMLSTVARSELADDGIVVSTVYPFITATEFHDTLRAGSISSAGRRFEPDTAEHVAQVILDLIRTGEAEAVLVPEQLRGVAP